MFNADAHFWYTRTQGFTKAVLKHDWADTYQNPKPGVTIMWLSGFGLETFLRLYEEIYHFRPGLYTYDTFPYIELSVKIPLLVVISILYLFSYHLLKKLTNQEVALTAAIFLVFQPFFLGITRYFHGDGTLTAFMGASAVSAIYYLKSSKKIYLYLSALFSGLAFLTKMQGFFLLAYIPFILFVDTVLNKKNYLGLIKDSLLFLVISVITVFAVFPALWVKPVDTLKSMFSEARVVTEEGKNGGEGDNIVYTKAIPKTFTLVSLVFFPIGIFFLLKNFGKDAGNPYLYSMLFIFFYSIQTILVFQKSERYLMPLFPFVSVISALGLYSLAPKRLFYLTLWIFLILSIMYCASFAPHYTAMAEEAPWGSLYSEAAEYLNKKANAADLKVIAVPKEHTFRPFFKGKTYGKGETLPNGWTPDYLVVASESYIPQNYSDCKFEHDIIFKKKVFWKIYKCK